MEQIIPYITAGDIKRIVKRDFGSSQYDGIVAILKTYKSDSSGDTGRYRVYASILKLSDGDIKFVKKFTDDAIYDYRDVIGKAEYPNYAKIAFEDDLKEEEEAQLIGQDWYQYELWLNRI